MTTGWILLPVMSHWAWPLSWAVVVAAVVLWLWPREADSHQGHSTLGQMSAMATRAARPVKGPGWLPWVLAVGVSLLAIWPNGGWSGFIALALQSPSLLSLTWAMVVVLQFMGKMAPSSVHPPVPPWVWYVLCTLGWLLTIDTLNLWPRTWDVSFYGWGFSASSLWLSAWGVAMLAWRYHGPWVWHSIMVLAVYALLRWPTGNVWDVWLDPAVWLVAHLKVLRHVWRCMRHGGGHPSTHSAR